MNGHFSKKFHRQTDFNFPLGVPPSDPQSWPKEWKEICHKTYPRFPKIKLSENLLDLGDLKNSLEKRHSQREFDLKREMTFEEFSTLIYYSSGVKKQEISEDKVRRFYPSGGARYPLEVYFAVQRVTGMTPGIYHYSVKDNLLEEMTTEPEYLESLLEGLFYPWSREAAVIIFITAAWNRNFMKYKDRGYRIVLMEAGHLGHNIALVASSLGIGCVNSVGFHNQRINEALDIENEDEDSLYMAVLGR
jgi:SagB-type dehydrogenase family enzyme